MYFAGGMPLTYGVGLVLTLLPFDAFPFASEEEADEAIKNCDLSEYGFKVVEVEFGTSESEESP